MWQTILFFVVINTLSAFMVWFDYKKTAIKISTFNKILYVFFGGATGFLLASLVLKRKIFSSITLIIALMENVGVYVLLYMLTMRVW